jgi:hypothetical protein
MNPAVTDYIFNVPEDTEFDLLPAQTQTVITQLSPEWPDFPMLNTHAVNARKLLMVRMKTRLSKAKQGATRTVIYCSLIRMASYLDTFCVFN